MKNEMKKNEIRELYNVMFPDYPDVVNVEQLGQMLSGVSTKTIYRLLRSGEIKSKYVGKRYLIPKLYVMEYLANQKQ